MVRAARRAVPRLVMLFTVRPSASSGVGYMGCYVDKRNDRDLPNQQPRQQMPYSRDQCATACRSSKSKYYALQYKAECWCGDSYGKHGTATNCKCPANSPNMSWKSCVYILEPTVPPTAAPDTPQPTAVPTSSPTTASLAPSVYPTRIPSRRPTGAPTASPTWATNQPTTASPSGSPTTSPAEPTGSPSLPAPPPRPPPPPPLPPPPLLVLEPAAAGATQVMTSAAALVASPSAGGLSLIRPKNDTQDPLPPALHPLRFSIARSRELGCLAGNAAIIMGVLCLNLVPLALLRRLDESGDSMLSMHEVPSWAYRLLRRDLEAGPQDIKALARFPGGTVLVALVLHQGVSYSGLRLAMGGAEGSALARVVGITAVVLTAAFGAALVAVVHTGLSAPVANELGFAHVRDWPLRPVGAVVRPRPSLLPRLLLWGHGEWVSRTRACHWAVRYQAVVRQYSTRGGPPRPPLRDWRASWWPSGGRRWRRRCPPPPGASAGTRALSPSWCCWPTRRGSWASAPSGGPVIVCSRRCSRG
eukprot:TRINITY_DN30258_c0_g1_i1.p1 TRINITY_DN30258_c0_g1~~TRINITY_DN30258_c0_g1_i1.p1  ORF type:complete len:551 (+),score=10.92 TRINITY_DN30258_c0_g1_i1:66-1655(+)